MRRLYKETEENSITNTVEKNDKSLDIVQIKVKLEEKNEILPQSHDFSRNLKNFNNFMSFLFWNSLVSSQCFQNFTSFNYL